MSDDQSTAHYVEQPPYTLYLRIAQVLLSILTLGLIANSINAGWNLVDEANFVLFCTIWSLLVVGYLLITPFYFPEFYNYWAQLGAELVACIFWFAGWIALSAFVGKTSGLASAGNCTIDRAGNLRCGGGKSSDWVTAAVACASSAIIWILFMATFAIFLLSLKRHRAENPHLPKSGLPYSGEKTGTGAHEMGNVAIAQQPQQYPMQTQTPVYPVEPTPPPQQWQQSPPPQQWQQSPPPQQQPYGQA